MKSALYEFETFLEYDRCPGMLDLGQGDHRPVRGARYFECGARIPEAILVPYGIATEYEPGEIEIAGSVLGSTSHAHRLHSNHFQEQALGR